MFTISNVPTATVRAGALPLVYSMPAHRTMGGHDVTSKAATHAQAALSSFGQSLTFGPEVSFAAASRSLGSKHSRPNRSEQIGVRRIAEPCHSLSRFAAQTHLPHNRVSDGSRPSGSGETSPIGSVSSMARRISMGARREVVSAVEERYRSARRRKRGASSTSCARRRAGIASMPCVQHFAQREVGSIARANSSKSESEGFSWRANADSIFVTESGGWDGQAVQHSARTRRGA
jgi:hypothetical protein